MDNGSWLSIIEYAAFRDISIGAARSFIKLGRVKSKNINGKLHVYVNEEDFNYHTKERDRKYMAVKLELDSLRKEISKLVLEKNDLIKVINEKNKGNINPLSTSA